MFHLLCGCNFWYCTKSTPLLPMKSRFIFQIHLNTLTFFWWFGTIRETNWWSFEKFGQWEVGADCQKKKSVMIFVALIKKNKWETIKSYKRKIIRNDLIDIGWYILISTIVKFNSLALFIMNIDIFSSISRSISSNFPLSESFKILAVCSGHRGLPPKKRSKLSEKNKNDHRLQMTNKVITT